MPTLRASNAEALYKAQTQGQRAGTVRGDECNAGLNAITTVITLEGDEAVNGVITLTSPLREGQVIDPALSRIVVPTAAGTLTADIGQASNPTAIAAAADIGGAGIRDLGTSFTDLDTFKAGEPLIATLKSATGLTAGRQIKLILVSRSV